MTTDIEGYKWTIKQLAEMMFQILREFKESQPTILVDVEGDNIMEIIREKYGKRVLEIDQLFLQMLDKFNVSEIQAENDIAEEMYRLEAINSVTPSTTVH